MPTNINKTSVRLGEEKFDKQGTIMKIVSYNNANDIVVEFQDKYHAKVHTTYQSFSSCKTLNPYYPSKLGVGIVGNKYATSINGKSIKEYRTWSGVLERSFDEKIKEKNLTYKDATCCNEWIYYENFYEWLHSQSNFDKWANGNRWALDKDILVKGNKIYSPETCCLVPINVNCLFVKNDLSRGSCPAGVNAHYNGYRASCANQLLNEHVILGTHKTPEEAFYAYKPYKEALIRQVAEQEYKAGNITKRCYNAMMNYEVEITD